MPNVIAINAAARKTIEAARAISDEMLLESIATGDRTAMHVLYSRHNVRVYRFVLRMLRDTTSAEDLVSQVFLDVWRTASQFEGRSQVSTWLLSIARFKALTALRQRKHEDPRLSFTTPEYKEFSRKFTDKSPRRESSRGYHDRGGLDRRYSPDTRGGRRRSPSPMRRRDEYRGGDRGGVCGDDVDCGGRARQKTAQRRVRRHVGRTCRRRHRLEVRQRRVIDGVESVGAEQVQRVRVRPPSHDSGCSIQRSPRCKSKPA